MAEPLLMIPGPTPVRAEVLAALGSPVRSHTSAENAATMGRIGDGLRACVGSAGALVHVFAGSGTLAMEAAVVNHVAPGQLMLVCGQGYFGDRFVEIGEAHGVEVAALRAPWGSRLDPEELRRACALQRPALVTITHVDTSTGVLADCASLAGIARDSGAVVVLDGVCATAGVEQEMDAWGVDVVLTGAQKALAVPPGLAILAVSERARRRREELGRINAYYADLRRWEPVVEQPAGRYFSTHATGMLRALDVSLQLIAAEGLEARFARHRRVAAAIRDGFTRLGFTSMTDAEALAPTLSVLAVPEGVAEAELRRGMAERGVVVAGCLGPFAGRGIRVGHMGEVGDAEVERTLEAAAGALQASRDAQGSRP
jgi:alanine-glyoxylate transaminase / serine-glyoxylate transaminase / serine-pyruvate transaminase